MNSDLAAILVLAAVLAGAVAGVSFYIYFGRLILQSRAIGAPVALRRMLQLSLAGLNANTLVLSFLQARRAGVEITLDQLEGHARRRGDPREAVRTLIAARQAGSAARYEDHFAA